MPRLIETSPSGSGPIVSPRDLVDTRSTSPTTSVLIRSIDFVPAVIRTPGSGRLKQADVEREVARDLQAREAAEVAGLGDRRAAVAARERGGGRQRGEGERARASRALQRQLGDHASSRRRAGR